MGNFLNLRVEEIEIKKPHEKSCSLYKIYVKHFSLAV